MDWRGRAQAPIEDRRDEKPWQRLSRRYEEDYTFAPYMNDGTYASFNQVLNYLNPTEDYYQDNPGQRFKLKQQWAQDDPLMDKTLEELIKIIAQNNDELRRKFSIPEGNDATTVIEKLNRLK